MASTMSVKLACVMVLCLVVGASLAKGAISCGQVISALTPCIPYVRNNGAVGVPAPCCNGIRSLNAAAQSTPERQSACNCVKALAASISGINYDLTNKLPGMCGVHSPFKISPSTNCKSVKVK
ncbi:non-specific lipid-transfer protein-like [Gossypium australe]|uniref:Non-specific lipid-transfer protein n=1 Tax=Gossypium australe TaxID=47621 RepID=A0A5B6UCF0_9ROSI|nr:non-specific lipid-transfer protein-like [Gossypium australe]